MSAKRKTLVLLDTHAILHRAYHALPQFSTTQGTPTGALYGLLTMLLKITKEVNPDYIVACYDLPDKTFRHEVYEGYKGTRSTTDSALIEQIIASESLLESLGISRYAVPGFEADDMLGTIVHQVLAKKEYDDIDIVIASGDMDTLQLVHKDRVRVYTLKKGIADTIIYNEQGVIDRYGFSPVCIPDYKGFAGDQSDNIIGVPGIGEKTATTLITLYGSLEGVYEALSKEQLSGISARIQNLLITHEEDARFSKTLATIRRDAPIIFTLPLVWGVGSITPQFKVLLDQYEFRSLGNKFFLPETSLIEYDEECFLAYALLFPEKATPTSSDIEGYTKKQTVNEAKEVLLKKIKEEELLYVYEHIEKPLLPLVKKMTEHGVLIDTVYIKELETEYTLKATRLEEEIYSFVGEPFNINSPKQLSEVLFKKLGLGGAKGKTGISGVRSTKESELQKIINDHPVVPLLLQYRELQKLLSTYISVLPALVDTQGRIHAQWKQTGTSTGRFSSEKPNLQNIPIKTELGRAIRKAFIAPPGYVLLAADYSQIELRLAALLSQDPGLLSVFEKNQDVHRSVAARVFGVSEDMVTAEMRRQAKVINFGILYGMGVTALKENLGTSRDEAQLFYDAYFNQFATLAQYLENTKQYVQKHGYTTTLFGRRRFFPLIRSPLPHIRAMAERMAINAPIQGTAADIMKIGMQNVMNVLKENGYEETVHITLQVHDEIVLEVPEKEADRVSRLIENALINVLPERFVANKKTIPITVVTGIGNNWDALK